MSLTPTVARSHFNLGVAQQAAGKTEAARQSLERALALEPNYAQARARLELLPPPPPPPAVEVVPEPEPPDVPEKRGPVDIASLYAPPKPDKSPSSTAYVPVAASGSIPMGLMGVGEDKGYVPPPPPPPVPAPPLPVLGEAGVPILRAAAPDPHAPSGEVMYDKLTRAESNAYLAGMYGNKNTSGMQGPVPPDVAKGFNLGAAIFPFWWMRYHNLRPIGIALVVIYFILRSVGNAVHSPAPGLIVVGLQIIMFFVLGFKGNAIAWQHRAFDDADDCRACQRIWGYWAVAGILAQVGFNVYMYLMVQSVAQNLGGGGLGGPPQGF